MENNYPARQESNYYDPNKDFYVTRNMDVAAYLEFKLGVAGEPSTFVNKANVTKIQFSFKNCLEIRDLLETYDQGEALVEPKAYSEIKLKIITSRRELLSKLQPKS